MLTFIPFLVLFLFVGGFLRLRLGWLRSLAFATIACSLLLVAMTELLSVIHALTRAGLALAWVGSGILGVLWLVLASRRGGLKPDSEVDAETGGMFSKEENSSFESWERWALYAAAAVLLAVALTAIFSAPNVGDAMEYHLPRVVEWIDQKGVQFYPTIDPQQLSMPPLAEYMMLHLYLLYGTDRLVNLVQWLGFVGSILGVTLIARELGGNRRVQAFAALLATGVPAALLAASGAKNDNVMTYWIVLTVYFLLVWRRNQSWMTACALGASGALAVFTKGTAYTFLPPLALACWMMWNARARRRFLRFLPLFAAILFAICAPLWVQNYRMTGSIFGLPYFVAEGPIEVRMFANSHKGPRQALAGVIRNVSNDVALPSVHANALLTHGFRSAIRAIGVDPDDGGQIWRNQDGTPLPFAVSWHYFDEILCGNQMNLLLLVVAVGLYLGFRRRMDSDTGWLAMGIAGSFVLFSAYVRWGIWSGHYQLPVFMLSVAFVAMVFSKVLPTSALRWIGVVVLVSCLPLVAMNRKRPWVTKAGGSKSLLKLPRYRQYFIDDHQEYADSFMAAAKDPVLRRCHRVGLDATRLRFEYPVMALIDSEYGWHSFDYLSVNNATAAYKDESAAPVCAVVCLSCADATEKMKQYGENAEAETFEGNVVFSNGGRLVRDLGAPAQ